MNIKKTSKTSTQTNKLVDFAEDILTILKTGKIEPILYGSLAYTHYIKDIETKINDIDFYIHENEFKQLIEILKISGIDFKYSRRHHTLSIIKETEDNKNLRLEFDSIEYWFPEDYTTDRIKLKELDIRILSKESLSIIYKLAATENSNEDKRKEYKIKLEKLKQK